tara:strand:+ start:32 stop:424 length:393 start_codon:yes stop_codon:yes gene_type:complete
MNKIINFVKKNKVIVIAVIIAIVAIFMFMKESFKAHKSHSKKSHGKKCALFHWKNCGHCKAFMPEWNKFKSMHSDSAVDYEKDEHPEMISKHNIEGFPTIKICENVNDVETCTIYTGERTSEALKKALGL